MAVNIKKAGRRLGLNRHFVKGRAEGMGIRFERIGTSLVMSEPDFARLKEALKRDGYSVSEAEPANA